MTDEPQWRRLFETRHTSHAWSLLGRAHPLFWTRLDDEMMVSTDGLLRITAFVTEDGRSRRLIEENVA